MSWTQERAKLARLTQIHPSGSREVAEARRDLRAARLEQHVQEVTAEQPPLTPEQRVRIASIVLNFGNGLEVTLGDDEWAALTSAKPTPPVEN